MSFTDSIHSLTHLQQLIHEMEHMLLPETALLRIAKGLGVALHARHVGIYVQFNDPGNANDVVLVAEYAEGNYNHPQASSVVAPVTFEVALKHEGEPVGSIAVDLGDTPILPDVQPLVQTICQQASLAVYAVKQLNEMRREREQLILAREEERRRLRRNLHDSVGPTLAALNLRSGAIRKLIQTKPEAAEIQMGELRDQIRSVITDIRRVIYDLRPPALDELGVLSAIREQARQMSLDGLEIDVDAPERLPALTAAAEVNAYFIICEALTNVLRHAQAPKCWVKIQVSEQDLVLEICDNGVGLQPGSVMGVGLNSMRERATELGGNFELESHQAQGLCVRASLPLRLALRNS